VEYPRYVCADCHHRTYWFNPYTDVCNVIEIRIDATWARYVPLRVGSARPRYYYQVRSAAPTRYRAWKERWSSLDGSSNLRTKFVLEREVRDRRLRDGSQRRQTPPEFKDLRRYRPGRLWKGRDEVIPLPERRERVLEKIRQRQTDRSKQEDKGSQGTDVRDRRDRGTRDQTPPPDARERERRREPEPKQKPEVRERESPKKDEGDSKVREERGRSEERGRGEDRSRSERRSEPPAKGRDREDRPGRGR
jgi:hypothetical protein